VELDGETTSARRLEKAETTMRETEGLPMFHVELDGETTSS
jgi:hypothetical protein